MTHLYLEHYLDSLESLPADLRRNFQLMHDLVKNLFYIFTTLNIANKIHLSNLSLMSSNGPWETKADYFIGD